MTNYVLTYTGGGSMPQTEAERAAVTAAWGAWLGGLGAAIVEIGAPFGASASIAADGSVTDHGAAALTGYSVVSADSLAAAAALAMDCPALSSGGSVDIYQIVPM